MVRFEKKFSPLCLLDDNVKNSFNETCRDGQDIKADYYKCKYEKDKIKYYPIREYIKQIYHNKCAYCETKFIRSYINIEHYRPKSIYCFLAYSWDNLLPICQICNTVKLDNFKIENDTRVVYDGKSLEKLQYRTQEYQQIEKPLFIHPEYDEYEIEFDDDNGKIKLENKKIEYTVKNADLNDDVLSDQRQKVFGDFANSMNRLYSFFEIAYEQKNSNKLLEFKLNAKSDIKKFFDIDEEYLAVRIYIIKNIDKYFDNYIYKRHTYFIKFFRAYLEQYINKYQIYKGIL